MRKTEYTNKHKRARRVICKNNQKNDTKHYIRQKQTTKHHRTEKYKIENTKKLKQLYTETDVKDRCGL